MSINYGSQTPCWYYDADRDIFVLRSPLHYATQTPRFGVQDPTGAVIVQDGPGRPANGEVPMGPVNGVNTAYTLSWAPLNGMAGVSLNGLVLSPALHYTLTGNTLTLVDAPLPGDDLRASYYY